MTIYDNNTFLFLTSYILAFLIFYFLITLMLYFNKTTEIKILNIIKDPKRQSRGRKQIGEYLEKSNQEKRLIWLWPYLLFKGLIIHVRTYREKKKK
mgnify:CR=1 FL=1